MSKLSEWVKEVRKEACEDCSSKDDLRVIRSGRTLCKLCFYKHHNKSRKVSGKRKERPLSRNSHRDRLWQMIEEQRKEIERLQSLQIPQTHGEEARNA